VTLVDVEHFEQRSEAQKQIMKTQVEVANII
jgi:G3E family GTPase